MTKLLEHLKEDWAMYTNEEEKRILNSYAHTGQFVIYGYVGMNNSLISLILIDLYI